MSFFSLPPLSISLGLPNPISTEEPTDSESFTAPSITVSFPDPTTTVRPPQTTHPPSSSPTTTIRPTTPTVSIPPSTTATLSHITPPHPISSSSTSSSAHLLSTSSPQPSRPPSAPESSPASNVQTAITSTTSTVTPAPTGKLSPSQPSMKFLDNKGAKAGVFSVVAIVALSLILGVGALIYRRKKRKQFDIEHNEAMVGYAPRAPIDGDDEFPLNRTGIFNASQKSTSGELSPPFFDPSMQVRHPDNVPVYLPSHLVYRPPPAGEYIPPVEEYNPYIEQQPNPFEDRQMAPNNESHSSSHEEHSDENVSEESMYFEPPSPWPRLGQLPTAFGSPGSEITLTYPRQTLRVTNGLDDSHA